MIQAKDLRIGNILLYNGKQVSVAGISSPQQIRLYDGIGMDEWVFIDQLSPVPLTDEMLIRFGLNVIHGTTSDKDAVYVDFKDYRLYLPRMDGFVKASLHYNADSIWYPCLRKLDYIHEYQNIIYSLTGEELTLQPTTLK